MEDLRVDDAVAETIVEEGNRDDGRKDVERDAREVHRLLCAALARLQRHPFVPADNAGSRSQSGQSTTVSTSKYALSLADAANSATDDAVNASNSIVALTSPPSDYAFLDLLYRLRDAHRASVYSNRCSDDAHGRNLGCWARA